MYSIEFPRKDTSGWRCTPFVIGMIEAIPKMASMQTKPYIIDDIISNYLISQTVICKSVCPGFNRIACKSGTPTSTVLLLAFAIFEISSTEFLGFTYRIRDTFTILFIQY
jgi:hypothetical protein